MPESEKSKLQESPLQRASMSAIAEPFRKSTSKNAKQETGRKLETENKNCCRQKESTLVLETNVRRNGKLTDAEIWEARLGWKGCGDKIQHAEGCLNPKSVAKDRKPRWPK